MKDFTGIKEDIMSLKMKFQGYCVKNSTDSKHTSGLCMNKKETDYERYWTRKRILLTL